MSNFQAVIFDLDGTLINSVPDIANACNAALAQRKHPLHNYEEYKQLIGKGLRNLCERALPLDKQSEDEIEACHAILMDYYLAHPCDATQVYEGIEQVLESLHAAGLKLAILSNKADILTGIIIEKLGLSKYFSLVSGLRKEFPRKPDPTSALWILSELSKDAGQEILPEQVLYIGDSGVDMQTANNSGFYALGVTWGFRSEDEIRQNGAKQVVHQALDILPIALG
jgi:phosphoglycolate phosphatase